MSNRRIHIRIHSITFDDEEAIGFKPKNNEKLTIEVIALSSTVPESAKKMPKASSNPISSKSTNSFEIMKNKLQIAACFQPISFRETSKAINGIPKIDKIEITLKIKQMLKADRIIAKAMINVNEIPEDTCEKKSIKLYIPQFESPNSKNSDFVAQSKSNYPGDSNTTVISLKPSSSNFDDRQFSRKRSYEKIEYYYDSMFNDETMKFEVGTIVLEIHNNNDRSLPFKPKARSAVVITSAASSPIRLGPYSIPVADDYSYDDKSNTPNEEQISVPIDNSAVLAPIEDVIILDRNENVRAVNNQDQSGIKLSDLTDNQDHSRSCSQFQEMFIFKDNI